MTCRAAGCTDTRQKYPEPRFWALIERAGELYVLVFCRRGDATRIISFREATKKEREVYG
jgi:uncharacterized DUF497 family protein